MNHQNTHASTSGSSPHTDRRTRTGTTGSDAPLAQRPVWHHRHALGSLLPRGLSTAFALALLAAPSVAFGQAPDLAKVTSQYLPPTDLNGDRPAGDSPWSNASDAQVSTYGAAVNLPLSLGEGSVLFAGLEYRLDRVSFSQKTPDRFETNLHSVELPVQYFQLLNENWALIFQASPGIAGDFRGFDSGLLRVSGLGLGAYSFSDEFQLGLGAAASYEFGSLQPLPIALVQWEPFENATVEALLPVVVEGRVAVGGRFEFGVLADIAGNSYALRDSRTSDAWPCKAGVDDPATASNEGQDPARCIDHVAYSVATAGATAAMRMVDSLYLKLFVGHTFFRRFEQMNEDNERVEGGMQNMPDVPFARVELNWRIPEE